MNILRRLQMGRFLLILPAMKYVNALRNAVKTGLAKEAK